MRFADVFLRLGTALVGWMLLYAHFLWLAVLNFIGCGPDGDRLHLVLLGISVLTVGAAVAVQVTRPIQEVHAMLRWLRIPLALLLPWILVSIWTVFQAVVLNSNSICSTGEPAVWQLLWVPAQLLVVALVLGSTWCRLRSVAPVAD